MFRCAAKRILMFLTSSITVNPPNASDYLSDAHQELPHTMLPKLMLLVHHIITVVHM
jgi:hypothetical protein